MYGSSSCFEEAVVGARARHVALVAAPRICEAANGAIGATGFAKPRAEAVKIGLVLRSILRAGGGREQKFVDSDQAMVVQCSNWLVDAWLGAIQLYRKGQ